MDVGIMQFPPGDSRMIDKIVHQLKSQGIFDQFRKECISDVDTKPAYQNLHQRVESTVSGFLASQVWRSDLNKNQLRDSLRKHIHESGFLDIGVERIVDQVVNPKIKTVFMPQVEDVVYSYLGIDRPKKGKENLNVHVAPLTIENLAHRDQKKLPTLTDLLPKELEPISPASDTKCVDSSFEEGEVIEDNSLNDDKEADEEEASPPFEPIAETIEHEENSIDSHLSGISELTSHGSRHSPIPPTTTTTTTSTPIITITNTVNQLDNSTSKMQTLDFTNTDSQLSKVSSSSRLSIVSFSETDYDHDQYKIFPDAEANEESQHSRMSPHISSQDTQHSLSMDSIKVTYTPTKAGESSQDGKKSPILQLKIKDIDENSVDNNFSIRNLNDNGDKDQIDGIKIDNPEREFKKEIPDNNENIPINRITVLLEENSEIVVKKENGPHEKENNTFMCKSNDRMEIDSFENEDKTEAKEKEPEQSVREQELLEKYEKEEEKTAGQIEGSMDRKLEFKTDRKHEERHEKVQDYIPEKRVEEKQQNVDDKLEKKQDEKLEKKSEEKVDRKHEKSDKKLEYGKKHDEKSDRKYDNKNENHKDKADRYDEKYEKRSNEKKTDDKQEKRNDEKYDKRVDSKTDKKLDERKSEKSKDSRERSRDKRDEKRKDGTGSSKDSKRSETNSHLDGDRKRSDKDKYKKERSESRNRSEKYSKHDSKEKDTKEKQKYDEKNDKENVKGKHKQERDAKDEKKVEEKERKTDREANKEKIKKEDAESLKHERDSRRKDKEGKERNKGDDKPRSKHDDRHKDRTKSTECKSDKEKSRDEKVNKEGSKSVGKDVKDRTKQESKDRGKSDSKDLSVKCDEKKSKDRKYDDKDGRDKSSKSSDKGSSKTPEKRKDDSESSKSSRSEHKNKDSGRKSKDSKSKGASDDHRVHRDKYSEDRRSTDRDSNGTAQDRAVTNVTSRTNGNDSQRSHSHRTKTNGNNSNNKSDNRGSSESAEMINEAIQNDDVQSPIANSPPSSLPFKKRPYSELGEVKEYQSSISSAGKLVLKTKKKPKIAANIFEVKKIMQLRKSIAKKERKQQKKLQKLKKSKTNDKHEVQEVKKLVSPDEVKRVKLGELENSLRKEVKKSLTNKELVPTNAEKQADTKYFASELESEWISQKDEEFFAFVKKIEKSETLSEMPTDSEDEVEELVQHKISLPYSLLETLVAKDIGAKLVRSNGKVHVILDQAVALKSHNNIDKSSPSASEAPKCLQSDLLKTESGNVPTIPNEYSSNMNDRSVSISEQSLTVRLETDECARNIKERPSSVNSTNSSDSCIILEETTTHKPEHHKVKNTKQRGISSRTTSSKSHDVQEVKSSQDSNEKKDRRRLLRPSTRYSSKEYAATCMTSEGHLQQGDNESYDTLLNEKAAPETTPIPSASEQASSNSTADTSTTKKVLKKSLAPSGLHKTHAARTLSAFVSDTEDESPVSNENFTFETGYCVIKDKTNIVNNIDKDLSEDEKDNETLNQELIFSTLQDLMIESGLHKPDIPTNLITTLRGTSVVSQTQESTEDKRPKLGRSRRVGLGKPIRNSGNQSNNDNGGSRTSTPSSADFVMPLSPESDVSASSGDAKKGALDGKVADGPLDPSPSDSDGKTNVDVADENRRTLRSSGAQRYASDDLYKPRPLFTPGSRRSRKRTASPVEETITSCATKRPATSMDVADIPPLPKRRR